jgi:hypothetical protein
MMHAPEMSPTLDDALRALDGASVNGVMNTAQLAAVRGFLEQLDDVRDVRPVVLDRAQAEHLEGAYLAGARCADESGHVLVMSLPAFLALCPPPVPAPRSVWAVVQDFALPLAGICAAASFTAVHLDQVGAAVAWMCAAAGFVMPWNERSAPSTACTYACNSGRACTCAPQSNMKGPT